MLKQILKNKLLLVALMILLLLALVVAILSMNTWKSNQDGKEDSDSAISGGLEIVQEEADDDTALEDSVTAPSTWEKPEEEAVGEDASKNQPTTDNQDTEKQPTTDNQNTEKQEQQETSGIPEDEAYEDKVPFGRIF